MSESVHIDLEHPDVRSRLPEWNQVAKQFVGVPKWVKSLPAEVVREESDGRMTYHLLPGEHGEVWSTGIPRITYGPVPDPDDELNIATLISLPKGSTAVISTPLRSVPPPALPLNYVETDPKLLELITICNDRIYNRVVDNAHIDDVFWQVNAIYVANPALAGGTTHLFMNYIFRGYAAMVVVALRTMVDEDPRSDSLWHLVNKMAKHCRLFTRTRHRNMLSRFPASLADEQFDKIAGAGEAYIPKAVFRSWQDNLKKGLSLVREHVNKRVAHVNAIPPTTSPTTDDIRRGLVIVAEVFSDCQYVLTAGVLMTSVPTIGENWLKVFRNPWLAEGRVPSYKHLDEFKAEQANKPTAP